MGHPMLTNADYSAIKVIAANLENIIMQVEGAVGVSDHIDKSISIAVAMETEDAANKLLSILMPTSSDGFTVLKDGKQASMDEPTDDAYLLGIREAASDTLMPKVGDMVQSTISAGDIVNSGEYEVTRIAKEGVRVKDDIGDHIYLTTDEYTFPIPDGTLKVGDSVEWMPATGDNDTVNSRTVMVVEVSDAKFRTTHNGTWWRMTGG